MADGIVQVAPDSTGAKIDTSEIVVGANTVDRQRVVLGDDSAAAGLAKIANAAPGSSDYGLVVRQAGAVQTKGEYLTADAYVNGVNVSATVATGGVATNALIAIHSTGNSFTGRFIVEMTDNGTNWHSVPAAWSDLSIPTDRREIIDWGGAGLTITAHVAIPPGITHVRIRPYIYTGGVVTTNVYTLTGASAIPRSFAAVLPTRVASQFPGYESHDDEEEAYPRVDTNGSLQVRGATMTDEGTFRCNFANTSLLVSLGSLSIFGNEVSGSFTQDIRPGDYFKMDADAETHWTQIDEVTPTKLYLASSYGGATSGNASRSLMQPKAGSVLTTFTVAAGELVMLGNAPAAVAQTGFTHISRLVDYGPLVFDASLRMQSTSTGWAQYAGLMEPNTSTPRWFARFSWTASTSSYKCETGRNPTGAPSSNEIETTTISPTQLMTPVAYHKFKIELLHDSVAFYVDGELVALHTTSIPQPNDTMAAGVFMVATAAPVSQQANINYINVRNHNRLEVGFMSGQERLDMGSAAMDPRNFSQAGAITINTDLMIIDCAKFRSLSIQCTSMGTSGVITPSFSNDRTTFVNTSLMTTAGVAAATFNAAGLWTSKVYGRYLRLRLTTAASAGTTTLIINGYNVDITPPQVQPVSGSVTATISGTPGTTPTPATTQGSSTYSTLVSAATNNATLVKGSAGVIGIFHVSNSSATARWLKIYNKATAPVPGTDVPVLNFLLPASSNFSIPVGPFGLRLATGIGYAITANQPTNDNTAIAAGDCVVSIAYT